MALIAPQPLAAWQINNNAKESAALLINTVQEMEPATLSISLSLNHMVEEMGHSPLLVSLSLGHMMQEMERTTLLCHFLSHMGLVITSVTIPTGGNR